MTPRAHGIAVSNGFMKERFELGFVIGDLTMEGFIEVFFGGGKVSGGVKDFTVVSKFRVWIVCCELDQE